MHLEVKHIDKDVCDSNLFFKLANVISNKTLLSD